MLSRKSYLIRAFYNWIVDSECTPYIAIDTLISKVEVPEEYIDKNGEIVLDVSPNAVRDLNISHKSFSFKATFKGMDHKIYAPIGSVIAIFAKENGEGISFESEEEMLTDTVDMEEKVISEEKKTEKPHLTLVH